MIIYYQLKDFIMAKRNLLLKGVSTIGHLTRDNLERVGSLLDSANAKTGQPRHFKAVNLGDEDYQQDLFREQTLKATQQLLGNRFATYGKYAKKIVPDSFFQSTVDGAFAQVAKLASTWSQIDLPSEHRFADISSLDDEQRYALATDIANQNRALATLGGLTGLAGLPGLLADTLWLLLVSLRTVYQLAAVYDQPLTGKQGVKMAYELLANADLSKMQEKQALLAGLGVGKGLLDNAQGNGLHSELKNLGLKNKNVNYYAEQVDSIASQVGIELDQINLSWIRRFLPATAVIVGMRYNSRLIEEVIGVARATFAPEAKLATRAITDDSGSEAEVKKDASTEKTEQDSTTDKKPADKLSDKAEDKLAAKADSKADKPATTDSSDKDSSNKDNSNKVSANKKVADKDVSDKNEKASAAKSKNAKATAKTDSENKQTAAVKK